MININNKNLLERLVNCNLVIYRLYRKKLAINSIAPFATTSL